MIHIAVCDDQQNDREYIILLVNHFFETSDFDVEIVAFESGQKLIEHCQTKPLDMVFLDIYLVDENGIEVAKKLREISSDCLLIFTTQSHEYAIDSYDVFAYNYLTKPINITRFNLVLTKAVEMMNKEKQRKIAIRNGKSYNTILHKDILYIESQAKKICFYTIHSEEFSCYAKLDEIEVDLNDNRFLRCHKSFIVNMDYIQKIDTNMFYLKNDQPIPIKQKTYTAIRQQYMDYISDKVNLDA